jgi:hypothetical protein
MFVLIDMLLLTNPRPDDAPHILHDKRKAIDETGAEPPRAYHTLGILLLIGIGVLNDPLLTLLVPAIALSLFLTNTRLPWWYWVVMLLVFVIGTRGIAIDYLSLQSYRILPAGWRNGARWVDMLQVIVGQFTIVGMARLSRWYPPLGTTTLIAYASYMVFGLSYTGPNREFLLLPLFVIHVLWITYAVFTLGEWLDRAFFEQKDWGHYIVQGLYVLLPLSMLLNIIT